jgi:hypothetical protein
VKRAQGVQVGRPPTIPASVVRRVKSARTRGHSYAKIAERLNEAGVPSAHQGRRWYPSTIRAVLERA